MHVYLSLRHLSVVYTAKHGCLQSMYWNGGMEHRKGLINAKIYYFINSLISDTDHQQGFQEGAKDVISPLLWDMEGHALSSMN